MGHNFFGHPAKAINYSRREGASSIVKVPGDVPPARVYFFKLSSIAKGIPFANLVHLVWARVCFLAILVDFSLGKVIENLFTSHLVYPKTREIRETMAHRTFPKMPFRGLCFQHSLKHEIQRLVTS